LIVKRLSAAILAMAWAATAADDLNSAARELAKRTAAAANGPVSVSWRNLASVPPDAVAQAKAAFDAIVRTTEGSDAQLTVSENAASGLLIEEFRGQVWMATFRRAAGALPGSAAIETRLLWEQEEPILDVAALDDGVLVLTPAGVLQTSTKVRARITPSKPWPRDLRGRLKVTGPTVEVTLPGMSCSGTWSPELTLRCGPGSDLVAGRNYFSAKASFYTAATADNWTLLALTDGTTGIFNSAFERVGTITGWGSDIAAANARCGGAPVVLATRPGEGRDAIQAYAIVNRSAKALGEAVEFAGPVTALWPGVAIVRNGSYRAYAISIVCGP
jgi:hypothetical protein